MVSKWTVYRAACIFALADAGYSVQAIKELEGFIADCFADGVTVEEVTMRATQQRVG